MEGLLIAEQLRALAPLLPARRRPWRFPDARTAVLPLAGGQSLWLSSRPPQPSLELLKGAGEAGAPHTPFQEQLAARAVGDLEAAEQPGLDRVVRLSFAAGDGFVPEPAVTLVAELTGRNANLVLLDAAGKILGVERVILSTRNRFRELKPGLAYVGPPPYDKLNPLEASDEALSAALLGRRLRDVRDVVDGVGASLLAALRAALLASPWAAPMAGGAVNQSAAELGAAPTAGGAVKQGAAELGADPVWSDEPLEGERLALVVSALRRLAEAPSAALAASGAAVELSDSRGARRLEELRGELRSELAGRLKLAGRRVSDAEQAEAAAADSERLRREADLLLANAASFEARGSLARLRGYDGQEVLMEIDPRLDAAGNARARYDRARRREARAARAAAQLPALRGELAAIERDLAALVGADERRLRELSARWLGEGEAVVPGMKGEGAGAGHGQPGQRPGAASSSRGRAQGRAQGRAPERHGVRFLDPRGYEVLVGRSAKENDAITFKLARSRDLWLHVQGYRGAHVVVRSQGRELPFDTVLFAARLAAGFSQARDSDNVPVDYTERKHVWRHKGGPAGAVDFAHHKTVYVTPARDDAAASGGAGGEAEDGFDG